MMNKNVKLWMVAVLFMGAASVQAQSVRAVIDAKG